jgi:O-antigen/teichoic acid export membrane protein
MWSILAQSAAPLAVLVQTPVLTAHLGVELYGVWASIAAVLTLLVVTDLGIGATTLRFLAVARDATTWSRTLRSGVLASLLVAMVLAVPTLTVGPALVVSLFSVTGESVQDVEALMRLLVVPLALVLLNGALAGALQSQQQFRALAVGALGGQTIATVLLVVGVQLADTPSIVLPLVSFTVAQTTMLVVSLWRVALLHRRDGRSARSGSFFGRPEWAAFGAYAWRSQLVSLSSLVNLQFDVILVAALLTAPDVAQYAVAVQVSLAVRSVPLWLYAPMNVEILRRAADGSLGDYRVIERSWRREVLVYAITIGAAMPWAVPGWLGDSYREAGWIAVVLVAGHCVNLLGATRTSVLRGQGRPGIEAASGVLAVVVNLAATLALIGSLGVYGVALGTSAAQATAWVFVVATSGSLIRSAEQRSRRTVRPPRTDRRTGQPSPRRLVTWFVVGVVVAVAWALEGLLVVDPHPPFSAAGAMTLAGGAFVVTRVFTRWAVGAT